MKSFAFLLSLVFIFSCNNSSAPSAASREASVDSVPAPTAAVQPAAMAPMQPFAVVYHYKAGFLIGGKQIGKPGEEASTVIADSMQAYIRRGGSIPDTLTCQFINDPQTGAPLMGARGAAKDAVKEALAIVKQKAAPTAFSVLLDKQGVHINGNLLNSDRELTPVIVDSMKAFSKRGGKIPKTVKEIFTYHSKDAEGMYHNEVKSAIKDALDSLKIK